MTRTIDLDQLEDLEDLGDVRDLFPTGESFLPEEYTPPPLVDPVEYERVLLELEKKAVGLKVYIRLIDVAVGHARQIKRDNGGTNRLFIYADELGIQCVECTPRLGRVEGRLELKNPALVRDLFKAISI